eukprot:TRINITY_DN1832_c0_g1_i1.p1 TRINITY_DN1832_c0_g1~~TRINITY_DN1832_c0_g1_i1.p1  ORF type:complete len:423 (+),score=54.95 TRINITY_DN1832_c0_g1_i1:116-1384(+)
MSLSSSNIVICAKCHKPLKIDEKTTNIHESALISFQTGYPLDDEEQKKAIARDSEALEALGESYVVLPSTRVVAKLLQAPVPQSTQLDKRINALINISEIASEKCQVEHPICVPCSESICTELDRQFKELERERETYKTQLTRLEKDCQSTLTPAAASSLPESDQEQQNSILENELADQLLAVRKARLSLKAETLTLERESKILDSLEKRFWEDYQDFQLDLRHYDDDLQSVRQKTATTLEHLERLKRTNIYDDVFHIHVDGHFGTINGFRLGKLPSQQVDWPEISAALGQLVLLLQTLSRDLQVKFSRFRLVPLGSFSKIKENDSVYELYSSPERSLTRFFWHSRFDKGMAGLLSCLSELQTHVLSFDPLTKFKYPVVLKDDTIGGVSVRLQVSSDQWTKAMKYLLTNIKQLISACSKKNL